MTQPEPPWGSNIVHYFHMVVVSRLPPGAERAVRWDPNFFFWRVEGSYSYASHTGLGSPAHLQNSEDIQPREATGDQKNSILFSLELTLTHSLTPAPVPRPHPVRRGPLLLSVSGQVLSFSHGGQSPRLGHQPHSVTQCPPQVPAYLILRGSQRAPLPLIELDKVEWPLS